jgi:hypothetical protein
MESESSLLSVVLGMKDRTIDNATKHDTITVGLCPISFKNLVED